MKRVLRNTVGVVLLLFLGSGTASAGLRKGPYLLYEGSNRAMTVLWQTDASETNLIRWGTDTGYGVGQASSTEFGDHQHRFVIGGLQPATLYFYRVDGYGAGSFRTAPASDATSATFLVYGDTRSDPATQERVVSTMRAAYASHPKFQSVALHCGDWVAADSESGWASQYFANANPQMHAFQAEVPVEGVRGNHEGAGVYFRKYLPYPFVSDFYWSFDYGPVHLVVLDQYVSYTPGSPEHSWLVNDLASTSKPWKIILLHVPGWSAGGGHRNNAHVQDYVQPLCERYGVDLVLGGHNHYYAHALVNGVHHLTVGGGGAPLTTPDPGYPNVVKADSSHHHLEIDVLNDTLHLTARRSDGSVIETATIRHTTPNAPGSRPASTP